MAVINGQGWNGGFFDNVWIDPVANSLQMRPMCKYVGWQLETTGIFAKPSISDYEFETSGNWEEFERYVDGGKKFLLGAATDNPGWVRTAAAPGLNRGVNLAIFGYGAGELMVLSEFGWDDTEVDYDTSAIGGRILSDGTIEIYKSGTFVGDGKIGIGSSGSNNLPHEILFLPMRRKELLVLGQGNDGFVVVFDDIAEDETSPVIVPDEKFWVKMTGEKQTRAQVQICPVKYEDSGYATSVNITFPRPPATGSSLRAWGNPVFSGITNANIYGDTAFAGSVDVSAVALVETDGSTAFVPDDVLNEALMKITLSSDGEYSPFIYGVQMQYEGETGETDDSEETEVDDKVYELSIVQGDDPWDYRISVSFREPEAIAASIAKFDTIGNRPVKVVCGDFVLMDGRNGEPKFDDELQDEAKSVSMDILSLTDRLKAFQFRDPYPLDGYYLSQDVGVGASAVREVAMLAGIDDSELILSTNTFRLPEIPGQICEEFNYPVNVGDDGQQAIEDLHQNFAADWFIGMKPDSEGMKFHFLSPDDLGDTPKLTLYRTAADAVTATVSPLQVYQSYRSETEKVNANEIYVNGRNPRNGELLMGSLIDYASQDPTTAPSSRPDNWLGEVLLYGRSDERFRSDADIARAIELLAPAVLTKRKFGEFTTPAMIWYDFDGEGAMVPLWRGDFVTLDGIGDVQITSVSATIIKNISGAMVSSARYTFGGMTNAGGTSLGEIQETNRARYAAANQRPIFNFGGVWAQKVKRVIP